MKFGVVLSAILSILTSPPSRGAWIEIIVFLVCILLVVSPPSRGAWIEI